MLFSIELPITYPQIEDAFRAFYAYMRHSEHFRHFFESDEQIDQLILRQAQNFYDSLSMKDQEFRQNYEYLGYMHAELNLPIEDMFAGLVIIRDFLLERVPAEYHQNLYQRIDYMEKWIAKGYFNFQIKEAKEQIDISFKNIEKITPEKHQNYVCRPLNWLSKLLTHYEDPNFTIESAQHCPLTPIIDTLNLEKNIRQQMHRAHKQQHILGQSLLFFYHEQNYQLVSFILSKLTSISLALSNQMSYGVSQEIIQKLQKDALTGLLLRHSLKEQYELIRNQAQARNEGFGILMMDIDFFKKINDSYGHLAGDKVLQTVGQLIARQARDHDVAFRYGGEEFLLFVTHLEAKHLPTVAERIRQAVQQLKIEYEGSPIPITMSIGCHWVSLDEIEQPLEQLIEKADKNLYQAKESGRNRVICSGIE